MKSRRMRGVRARWGLLPVPIIQRQHRQTGEYRTCGLDPEMDQSGWLPEALDFLLDMGTQLPPGVAQPLCHKAGFQVSRAELDRLLST
ncbi:hypothetical protein [Deinococcus sp.]|uniref:hypothetical protein n=1 Tax=Deinococcus sp. TaxID=47478 RepID=UPI0025D074BE|nr:hypothetical protein [Deinococcus sp.]